jgi:hypothetical protein
LDWFSLGDYQVRGNLEVERTAPAVADA